MMNDLKKISQYKLSLEIEDAREQSNSIKLELLESELNRRATEEGQLGLPRWIWIICFIIVYIAASQLLFYFNVFGVSNLFVSASSGFVLAAFFNRFARKRQANRLPVLQPFEKYVVFAVATIIACGAFYTTYKEEKQTANDFLESDFKSLLHTWSKSDLLSHSTPKLAESIEAQGEPLVKMLQRYSKLGMLKDIKIENQNQIVYYNFLTGTHREAYYDITALYDIAKVKISLKLVFQSGRWQIASLNTSLQA